MKKVASEAEAEQSPHDDCIILESRLAKMGQSTERVNILMYL
jgi:hypothetical protein